MQDDDLPLSFKTTHAGAQALANLMREDLDPYSVDDLGDRIALLESEVRRAKAAIERKKSRRGEADALFSFKGT